MKRKFLAKAVTLGLMLAVPFGAYAEKAPELVAEKVIINNVAGKTEDNVKGITSININDNINLYTNIHTLSATGIGLGIVGGESVKLGDLKITNSIQNFTDYSDKYEIGTELTGLHNVNGKMEFDNVDIDLAIKNDNKSDMSIKNGGACVFGIRTREDQRYNKTGEGSTLTGEKAYVTVNGDLNINLNTSGESGYAQAILLQNKNGSVIDLKGNTKIVANATENIGVNRGISAAQGENTINVNNLDISLDGGIDQYGIITEYNTQTSVKSTKNLHITLSNAQRMAIGLGLKEGEFEAENVNIKISDIKNIENKEKITGIRIHNNKAQIHGDVNIDVENGYAIKAEIVGDEFKATEKTIRTLANDFTLGEKDSTVKIKGDIAGGTTDYTKSIILNLSNAQSSFEGATTGKVDLNLQKGSTWTNTGASTVNKLTLNGANLVQGNDTATIIKANDGKFEIEGDNTIALNTSSDGSTMDAGENAGGKNLFANDAFAASDVDSKTTIKLTSANQNAGDISKENAAKSFNKLVDALGDSNLKSKVTSAHLDGTYIIGEIDATADNGSFTGEKATVSQQGTTETIEAIKKLPSINLISWRTENNELSKRLGEVRDYDGEEGIWARMNHGESKYLDSFKTKGHLYQMGYDKKVGEWRLGGAVSYNKGTTTYENGNGKNRSTSLALYGAWLGDKGHYADIIVKEGKQKSEMTIGQTGLAASNLDYDLWATSISAEYGRKIALKSDWFVEPQAELTYGRLGSADYGDNGFSVHQDSMDSLVGRMGFRLGKNLSDTSNIYMKASVLHEFCGDVDYSFTEGTNSKVSSADLGDTWYEVGVGGSAQIGKATYAYAGIEKTFGGDFSTPWQWNAGVRWSF